MSAGYGQIGFGVPASFPLPNPGNPGTAFTANSRMHPAALAGLNTTPKTNPMNAGHPAMAGKK